MNDELRAALEPVANAFEALGVEYRVGGSVASSTLGVGRTTLDVDLVADLHPVQVPGFVERLGDAYYADADMVLDAIRHRSSFNIIHLATMMKIDVFILKPRAFDLEAFARVTREALGEESHRTFPLTTAEDIILHKLEWYRLGERMSERQWEDVIGVLRMQRDALDRTYLDRWARELGVDDLLHQAIADAATS